MSKKHIGSNFDDFLAEKAMLEDASYSGEAGDHRLANRAGNEGTKANQDRVGRQAANQQIGTQPLAGYQRYQPDADHLSKCCRARQARQD